MSTAPKSVLTNVVLDSSAWIEYVLDAANADMYAKLLQSNTTHVIVPSICLLEVHRSVSRLVSLEEALAVTIGMERFEVDILSPDRARQAADISRKHQLSAADAIVYATAIAHNATLYTQDADFISIPGVQYIKHKRR